MNQDVTMARTRVAFVDDYGYHGYVDYLSMALLVGLKLLFKSDVTVFFPIRRLYDFSPRDSSLNSQDDPFACQEAI